MHDLDLIAQSIAAATGRDFTITAQRNLSGGCINSTTCVTDGNRYFLIKANSLTAVPVFRTEALGLEALAATGAIRVPEVIAQLQSDTQAYLVLEYISHGQAAPRSWRRLGEQLAALHMQPQSCFGWPSNNYIGSTIQPNPLHRNWCEFFRVQRLEHMLKLCREQGVIFGNADRVIQRVSDTLASHRPSPSLVHGDLWSGNVAFDADGQPFIYDPACYWGDRETDLAFSEFFGGFPSEFYDAYQATYPVDSGYTQRKQVYNLYHCLNHVVLFDGSYVDRARAIMQLITQ